ncbi:pleckstrin homology domain-containing family G member 5 [Trichomycterus rosablanca]|uniref:pleckstrin homology domain-containing family G member 5 n=1 Tax=Trichomycterus rosablanca TaxID=2290929 RepID=UPI002F358D94
MIQVVEPPLSPRRAVEKQKYYTLGHQKRKQNPNVDFSTVNKGTYANLKSRGALMQVLFNQGPSDKINTTEERGSAGGSQAQVEALKHALESFSVPAELSWKWGGGGRSEAMEKSWTDIVPSHESMTKKQRHQQEALWELLHTELVYINQLTIIIKLILGALDYVHQEGFLNEITSAQLFCHLPSILQAHQLFWQDVLYPMLLSTRLTGHPFDPLMLKSGFLRFSKRFTAYSDYCWMQEKNMEFTRTQLETNLHFSVFLQWVESHPYCGRMRMGDMQAKPHQRITKYPLLLKAILKSTQDSQTQSALNCMHDSVSQFLESINNYLQIRDDRFALVALSQRIEGYEMVGLNEEIDNYIQESCRFDLTSAVRGTGPNVVRKLILGETLKVRGSKDSKLEVVMLLFTDVLLLTKSHKKSEKQKVVRPPLSLERVRCVPLKDGFSFLLVEMSDLGCAVSVYSVTAPSPESCTAWISFIRQAQETLETLRNTEEILQEESKSISSEKPPDFKRTKENRLDDGHLLQTNKEELNSEAAQNHEESLESESELMEESDVSGSQRLERRVTWNHVPKSRKNSSDTSQNDFSSLTKYVPEEPVDGSLLCKSPLSPVTDLWNDSWFFQDSDETTAPSEPQAFSRAVRSSRLPRKRPMSAQPFGSNQSTMRTSSRNGFSTSRSNRTSSTSSDCDVPHSHGRFSDSSSKLQDAVVLKLGSLKQNGRGFWNDLTETTSPDPQTPSNTELLKETKTQINGSVSNAHTASLSMLSPSTGQGFDPDLSLSPLQGSLMRALKREKKRELLKQKQEPVQTPVIVHPIPSPSLTDTEQESEGEEMELFTARRIFFSDIEMEISVDDTEIEDVERPDTPVGVNVDWPSWYNNEDETLEYLESDERSVDWFEHTLTGVELQQASHEGEYSEV